MYSFTQLAGIVLCPFIPSCRQHATGERRWSVTHSTSLHPHFSTSLITVSADGFHPEQGELWGCHGAVVKVILQDLMSQVNMIHMVTWLRVRGGNLHVYSLLQSIYKRPILLYCKLPLVLWALWHESQWRTLMGTLIWLESWQSLHRWCTITSIFVYRQRPHCLIINR